MYVLNTSNVDLQTCMQAKEKTTVSWMCLFISIGSKTTIIDKFRIYASMMF